MRRLLDSLIAVIAIIVAFPILITCAVLVRVDSSGPIFFRQQRVGQFGRIFEIIKFRTMYVVTHGSELPLITIGFDPRITPIGAYLRKWKLDELPQLWNVLRGDMALVGPRPEVPKYVGMYPSEMRDIILSVRPGITDPCSILLRDESAFLAQSPHPERFYVENLLPEKLRISSDYVRSRTLQSDIRILIDTLRVVVFSDRLS